MATLTPQIHPNQNGTYDATRHRHRHRHSGSSPIVTHKRTATATKWCSSEYGSCMRLQNHVESVGCWLEEGAFAGYHHDHAAPLVRIDATRHDAPRCIPFQPFYFWQNEIEDVGVVRRPSTTKERGRRKNTRTAIRGGTEAGLMAKFERVVACFSVSGSIGLLKYPYAL